MLKYFLCLKYLRKKKMILLSIAAVALSAALLIVVGSLFSGFINTLENTAENFVGDVVITPMGKIHNYQALINQLNADPNIYAATPVLNTQGLLHIGKGRVKAVNVWGIDPVSRAKVTNLSESLLLQTDPDNQPTFYPSGENKKINGFASIALLTTPDPVTDKYDFDKVKSEYIGKKVVLTSGSISKPDGDVDFSKPSSYRDNFKVKKIPLTISDVVFTGIHQIDSRYLYLPIDKLSQQLYPEQTDKIYANLIHIKLNKSNSPEVIASITRIWERFARTQLGWAPFAIARTEIETTRELQAAHAAELRKQMHLLQAIFGIVSTAVVLLIFCIFYMIVTTKLKDIAVIKSFGASSSSVAGIFIFYGLLVGILGAALGYILSYAITTNINEIEQWIQMVFGLKLWDASVYLFEKTPDQIDYGTVAWVLPAAVIASLLGAIIPAISAARLKPVKLLQYE